MGELQPLSQAITELKSEQGKYKSTGLALAQQDSEDDASVEDSDDLSYLEDSDSEEDADADEDEPEAFVQVATDSRSLKIREVIKMLGDKAKALKSPALAALSVRMSKDHFGKIRGLIKDLVNRLEAEATAEADKHAQCTTDMNKATSDRDSSQADMETEQGNISKEQANIAEAKKQIARLTQEIADLNKALAEATELRKAEREENERIIADAKDGRDSVKQALKFLNKYYGSLVQTSQSPATDRSGSSIGDLAPEGLETNEDYRQGEESKGIIGILNVIQSDYQRTVTDTDAAEKAAQKEFKQYEKDTKKDIKAKEKSRDGEEQDKTDAEGRLDTAEDNLETATKNNNNAKDQLALLKTSCVDTEISYEERVKRREQEIESLKSALEILEGMSFLQKRK